VNNWGVVDGVARDENEVIPLALSFEWQAANASKATRGHPHCTLRAPLIIRGYFMVSS
jgi:hypothetical protein